jgi:hypothetical protein
LGPGVNVTILKHISAENFLLKLLRNFLKMQLHILCQKLITTLTFEKITIFPKKLSPQAVIIRDIEPLLTDALFFAANPPVDKDQLVPRATSGQPADFSRQLKRARRSGELG